MTRSKTTHGWLPHQMKRGETCPCPGYAFLGQASTHPPRYGPGGTFSPLRPPPKHTQPILCHHMVVHGFLELLGQHIVILWGRNVLRCGAGAGGISATSERSASSFSRARATSGTRRNLPLPSFPREGCKQRRKVNNLCSSPVFSNLCRLYLRGSTKCMHGRAGHRSDVPRASWDRGRTIPRQLVSSS